jgi:hypothetical protein
MGQGRYPWLEAWFPDNGWVLYDQQNMQLFVSNRFVRIAACVDNNETRNDLCQLCFRFRPNLRGPVSEGGI